MGALHLKPRRPGVLILLAPTDSRVLPSSVRPSVWAPGDRAFEARHHAQWQTLHNGCWFYYHSTTGGGDLLFYCSSRPPPSVADWWLLMCTLQLPNTHTHTNTGAAQKDIFCLLASLTLNSKSDLTFSYAKQQRIDMFLRARHFRHAHLPMCSLTLTWVGFPAVQAVSSINMCLLAGDPYVCITGRQ